MVYDPWIRSCPKCRNMAFICGEMHIEKSGHFKPESYNIWKCQNKNCAHEWTKKEDAHGKGDR